MKGLRPDATASGQLDFGLAASFLGLSTAFWSDV